MEDLKYMVNNPFCIGVWYWDLLINLIQIIGGAIVGYLIRISYEKVK